MQVLMKIDDFSTSYYDLRIGDMALEFDGKEDAFSLPYLEIKDFPSYRIATEKYISLCSVLANCMRGRFWTC